ncbi:MAG: GYDIA family GHMP kinase [Bacteroidales bacterium]
MPEFRSHGKFLITGEYFVMKGVPALAVPLKKGQKLTVVPADEKNILRWDSFFNGKLQFASILKINPLRIVEASDWEVAERLLKLLALARQMNPDFLAEDTSLHVVSEADFESDWGMGSSSTLVSNIAYWAGVDPVRLNAPVFNGSGYDILCARASGPLIYRLSGNKPLARLVSFRPSFAEQIYFVYTGSKTNTRSSLQIHLETVLSAPQPLLDQIAGLTDRFVTATQIEEFEECMHLHERIVGKVLGKTPVKEERFSDFNGQIKSLGAWDGDFIMVTWKEDFFSLHSYMRKKNAGPVFSFDELILHDE